VGPGQPRWPTTFWTRSRRAAVYHSEAMPRRRKGPPDHCRLCGSFEPLSFEHVPNRAAFNTDRFIVVDGIQALEMTAGVRRRGRQVQGGVGGRTLCEKCNSNTGSWYGGALVNWAYQARDVLVGSGFRPILAYPYQLFPLRVLKQIVTMFFSINSSHMRQRSPELADFILSRASRFLPEPFRVFVYFTAGGASRAVGMAELRTGWHRWLLSELTFPPFGYVLTVAGPGAPHRYMEEITNFGRGRYGIDDHDMVHMQLPVLTIESPLPGVYLTEEDLTRRTLTYGPVMVDGQPTNFGEAFLSEPKE